MKAAVIRKFGSPDIFSIEDVATPKPRPGHMLIKVLAAGVNRFDAYLHEGTVVPQLPFPHILGADAAGEVAELGSGVDGFTVGERVIPATGFPQSVEEYDTRPAATAPSFTLHGFGVPGTYAQYLEVPSKWVIRDETGLSPEEAATLPMVVGTSVRAVKEIGAVKPGDKVLIQAGASGSGSMHIQVAKTLGAQVAATVRSVAKGDLARKVGADLVINTSKEDLSERIKDWTDGRGVDVVLDNLGGDILAQSIEAARPLGTIVAYGFAAGTDVSFDIRSLFFGQKRLVGSMANDLEDLAWGLAQVRLGKIRPVLDRTFPLSEAANAHRAIASNEVAGNIVLLPWAA